MTIFRVRNRTLEWFSRKKLFRSTKLYPGLVAFFGDGSRIRDFSFFSINCLKCHETFWRLQAMWKNGRHVFAEKREYIFIILIWKRLYFFHSEHSRSCLQNIMGKRKDRGIRTYLDVSEKDILIDVVLKGVTRLLYWKNSIILFTIKDLLMLLLGDKTIEFCVVIWIFTKTVFVHSSIYIPW